MLNIYNYIFYRFYFQYCKTTNRTKSSSAYFAVVSLTWVVLFNIFTILIPFRNKIPVYPDWAAIIPVVILLLLNSYWFFRKEKYLEIEKKYANENPKQRERGGVLTVIYVVLSFLSLIILGCL